MPCPNCHSNDVWDDVSGWGCNKCGWSSFGMLNTTRTPSNPNDRYEVENRPRDYDKLFGHDPGLNMSVEGRNKVLDEDRERSCQDNERIHNDWKSEKARAERERVRKELAQLRCPNNCGSQMVPCNGAHACPICDADVVKRDGRYGYLYARRH